MRRGHEGNNPTELHRRVVPEPNQLSSTHACSILSFIVTINSDCHTTLDINVRASLNATLLLRSKRSLVAAHLLPPFRRKHPTGGFEHVLEKL
jgi:hypothetical protein